MKTSLKRSAGGRPTREEAELLGERILEVATELMLAQGYSETSIEAIASAAGVAKRTLYSRFPDKGALFAGVLQRRREIFLAPLQKILEVDGTLEERLREIGNYVLNWAFKADTVRLRRLIAAEVARFPDLSFAAHTGSRRMLVEMVSEILAEEVAAGNLVLVDPNFAALQFLSMTMMPADLHTHYNAPLISGPKRRKHILGVVDLFLCGGRPR